MHGNMSKEDGGERPSYQPQRTGFMGWEPHAMHVLLFCMGPSAAVVLVSPKKLKLFLI